jgi:hypothetical protein
VKEERLGSPAEFAHRLGAHLAGFARAELALPDARELALLVEATFYASLHEEEARRAEFNVAWQAGVHACASVVAIAAPVRATPRNLAKLAPATRREASSIAVRRDGDHLVAWALLEHGAAAAQPLTIRVLGSGVLRVDYAGLPRALYVRGELLFSGGGSEVTSPAQVLTRTFAQWSAGADPATGVDLRAAVVARVAARALEHHHGGMILVIPAALAAPVGVRVHYGVADGTSVLARRYAEVIRDVAGADQFERLRGSRPRGVDGRVPVRDEAQIAFAEGIELLARLTAIDNAVLLDTDLRLRGFGVQVLEGDAPHMDFTHADPYSGDVHVDDLSTFKGTRHPAGVLFCMRQDEAAAIIASQDGHLSLAVKKAQGGVEVVGSYERAFGWI